MTGHRDVSLCWTILLNIVIFIQPVKKVRIVNLMLFALSYLMRFAPPPDFMHPPQNCAKKCLCIANSARNDKKIHFDHFDLFWERGGGGGGKKKKKKIKNSYFCLIRPENLSEFFLKQKNNLSLF